MKHYTCQVRVLYLSLLLEISLRVFGLHICLQHVLILITQFIVESLFSYLHTPFLPTHSPYLPNSVNLARNNEERIPIPFLSSVVLIRIIEIG